MLILAALAFALDAAVEVGEIEVADSARATVDEALAALRGGKFDEAATLYGSLAEAGGGAAARTAQAVALYEAGDLRAARVAAEDAARQAPRDSAALNVLGLVLVDSGRLAEGVARLEEAKKAARSAGRPASEARAANNLALAHLDAGDPGRASKELDTAEALARDAGDPELTALATATRQGLAALGGTDAGVGGLLGKGATGEARKTGDAALARATTRRDRLVATLDLAAVDRAEGRLDEAARKLADAATQAREAGLVREHAAALVNLGLVQSLAGRLGPAADTQRAAAKVAREGGYRVVEVDARCELGFALLADGLVDAAADEHQGAGVVLATMSYPLGAARQAELGGIIAGRRGDLGTAKSALSQAAAYYAERGRNLDAARAATELAAALEAQEPSGAPAAARKAESYFAAAGDRLGPAHVKLARGLAAVRAGRLEDGLRGFAEAAAAAEAVGGGRGTTLARIARENAAASLVLLGHDADVAKLASDAGLADLVKRQESMVAASRLYDEGLGLYGTADFAGAEKKFSAAREGFEKLEEKEYALRARRSAAWSRYNVLVVAKAEASRSGWKAFVEEAAKVEDAELYARAYGAAVLADHDAKATGLDARLAECIRLATKADVNTVASRCHGAVAEAEGDLATRASHARDAFRLYPDGQAGVYALYAVAVDAYNAGDSALALQLATLARTRPGQLAAPLDEVIAAARAG